jgi:hypothetical protein
MHLLLFYEYVEDYVEKRKPLRGSHFAHAQASYDRGELALAGAYADSPAGGVLVFRGDRPEIAREFAQNDPYVLNGLVTSWHVRPWTTVLGDGKTLPQL